MKRLQLVRPVPIGRLLDALEHLPEFILTPQQSPSLVQSVGMDLEPVEDEESLRRLYRNARKNSADVVLLVDPERIAAQIRETPPLPLISVHEGTATKALSRRLRTLETDGDARRVLAEVRARDGVVTIADRAAEKLGGHIIVEDQNFQMLAYSRLSSYMDEARREAILQRQMPATYGQIFDAQGVQASLISGEDVVQSEAAPEVGLGPRLIVAIRHHGRLVGTIWFARDHPAFDAADIAELQACAGQMGMLLAETLREQHDERIRQDDAVLDLLHGRDVDGALQTLGTIGPDFRQATHVVTFAQLIADASTRPAVEAPTHTPHLAEFRALAEFTARTVRNEVLTVVEGDRLHIIHFGCDAPPAECDSTATRHIAERLAESLGKVNLAVTVGIGRHAPIPQQLSHSAQDAVRVVSGLVQMNRAAISTVSQAWATLMVDSFLGVPRLVSDEMPKDLRELLGSTAERDREQLLTVRVALDHWGDIALTAKTLHVHQNTVRYRLQRFQSSTGIDLEAPGDRLALWMLLVHLDLVDEGAGAASRGAALSA